jgi:hypothetical protein
MRRNSVFERSQIAERLWAHAVMCDEAASLYFNERVAGDLERLAENCREAAFTILREEISALWKH